MNTQSLRLVVGGLLAALVMVVAQGCSSTGNHRRDGRPHKIRPHHDESGLQQVQTVVVVQKRSTPSAAKKRRAALTNLGTQTIDFTTVFPSGCPTPVTLHVKCYSAVLDNSGTPYYLYNDETALPVFGGTSGATVQVSSSNPTGSVNINVDNQSGNFFYIGASGSTTSGGNTYNFTGGMILTKP
ncbi:MAG: hypothetical protein ACO1QR_06835 [Chthoniobacteraceae bacterium]